MTGPAYRIDGRVVAPETFYAAACDPRRSIVVEACAGAGKTWMLVSRILRALLDGAQPHEILALTFTRKAAGEMRARLNQWLREFSCAGAPDEAQLNPLAAALRERGLDAAQARTLAPALGALHGQLLQSGRNVAIRSFHAWFAQLLAAAPLDLLRALRLPSQPTLVEDPVEYQDELFARFHARVQGDATLRATYFEVIRRRRLGLVTRWLQTAWQHRIEIERADAAGTLEPSVPPAASLWPDCVGLATPKALVRRLPLAGQLAALAVELGAQANKTPRGAAESLRRALDEPDPALAYAAVREALMTKDGTPRKRMGDLPAHEAACEALNAVQARVDQQAAHEEHLQMVAVVRVLLAEYALLKQRHGLADMGDLETAALALLCDPTLSGWVQERLDTRLKHLLIDEFQDTSPLQWQALLGWLSSYAGAGGGASGQRPLSVFIVGDPKQSIYRFRRAEPRVFEAAREFVVQGLEGAVLECDHTRRCAPEVVAALNAVFEPAASAGEWPGFRAHTTSADSRAAGLWRLPDVLRPGRAARDSSTAPVWRDTLTEPRHEAEEQLRAQEARQVANAIAGLLAAGRRPSDIMVLSRKRVALRAVSEALSALQLPHVMPEAMRVGETPEAQDLLAVIDVLVSPGHDLALARALRSPVFGASDADLLRLSQAARGAGRSWWAALTGEAARWDGALAGAAELLCSWAEVLAWLPPHDLLDRIVHESDFVARLAAAAPPARRGAALQAVDALLAAALEVDGGRYASPYGFVRALRSRAIEAALVPPPTRCRC
jgi:ATP-dependent helicase/nuclease subunit A